MKMIAANPTSAVKCTKSFRWRIRTEFGSCDLFVDLDQVYVRPLMVKPFKKW
jgi:hypothetical protein